MKFLDIGILALPQGETVFKLQENQGYLHVVLGFSY